jgi:hypothetical protein
MTSDIPAPADSAALHDTSGVVVLVTAHNEAERIAATLAALAHTFPGAPVWVADDGSRDETAAMAQAAGAHVVRSERGGRCRDQGIGKGGAATLAAHAVLRAVAADAPRHGSAATADAGESLRGETIVVLCDGDLGDSAGRLGALVETVRGDEADLAVAVFARRVGGGVGLALGFARWAVRRRCGLQLDAPISGQRAMPTGVLAEALPFAPGFGMEIGMTIDVARAGLRVMEVELDLHHRATGRTLRGFAHRGRQLLDFVRVYIHKR